MPAGGLLVIRRFFVTSAAVLFAGLALAPPAAAGLYFYCYAEDNQTLNYESNVPGRIAVTVQGTLDERAFVFPDITTAAMAQHATLKCSAPGGEVVTGSGSIRLRFHPAGGSPTAFPDCEIRFECGGGGLKLKKD
jgi:hypothetical protein